MVKRLLFGVLVLGVLGVIFGGGGNDEGAPAASSDVSTSTSGDDGTHAHAASDESAPTSARVGQRARDDHFEFTLKSLSCGVRKIGARFLTEKAQGQFCVATIKVSNLGVGSQGLDGASQYLYDGADRQFVASTAEALELHDSTFSGGVVVDLP